MPLLSTIGAASNKGFNPGLNAISLPVMTPELWFRSEDLSSVTEGDSITTWINRGSLSTGYDLVSPSVQNSNVNSVRPLLKNSVSGFPGAYSDGSTTNNRFLVFRNFNNSPGSAGVYFFDGNISGGTTKNDRTIFYVYYWPGTSSTSISAFGTYHGNITTAGYAHAYGNIGHALFSTNAIYVIMESNDAFPIGSATGINAKINTIAQSGHVQYAASPTTYLWQERTGSYNAFAYTDGVVQVNPVGIGYGRAATINIGYLFEIIVYGRALDTSTEIPLIRNYLGAKYGSTSNS